MLCMYGLSQKWLLGENLIPLLSVICTNLYNITQISTFFFEYASNSVFFEAYTGLFLQS